MRGTDRGEVSFGLIVVAALLAGALAAVPFMLMGRHEAQSGRQAVGSIDSAQQAGTRASLQQAMEAAQAYFASNGAFTGLTSDTLKQEDPTIPVTTGPAAPGQVSLRGVTPTSVVLVSADGSGGFVCAAATPAGVVWGSQDAQSASQCSG